MIRILLAVTFLIASWGMNAQEIRSFDGSNNNLSNPGWGSAGDLLQRMTQIGYADGISEMGGKDRMNPRIISNILFDQQQDIFDPLKLSDFIWAFGQLIDHDISLTESNFLEPAFISVPEDDAHFAPGSAIMMFRSVSMPGTGLSENNPRQHVNMISAFIDGSAIYGSDMERADWLRSYTNGKLRVSQGNLLPWNTTTGEFNDPKDPKAPFMADDTHSGTKLFVAGDIRANENPVLLAMHTLFVREHNRMCDELKTKHPGWTDEQLYQQARKYIGGYIQSIVYNEWLPIQGVSLPQYKGYNENIHPGIFNVFSAAAFRLGHTLLSSNLIRMNNKGDNIDLGNMFLKDAFFNPVAVLLSGGIEPFIKGMATQVQQDLDCKVIDDVRNFLFSSHGNIGLDLAAININRGRDRGLPDYNTVRDNLGLARVNEFTNITKDQEEAAQIELVYGTVDNIDPWVGMLAESHLSEALFGETIMIIIERQFQNLRDGDRFFFENDNAFTEDEKEIIRNTTLRDIIMRNSNITLMQENVFSAMPHSLIPNGPDIPQKTLASVAYPNPTEGEFTIKIYAEEEIHMNFRIFGPDGRLILDKEKILYAGENFVHFDITGTYTKGLYNVMIEAGFQYQILKIFKN